MGVLSSAELIEKIKATQSPEELHFLMAQNGLAEPLTDDEVTALEEQLWQS